MWNGKVIGPHCKRCGKAPYGRTKRAKMCKDCQRQKELAKRRRTRRENNEGQQKEKVRRLVGW